MVATAKARSFLDTNIFVYAVDILDPAKQERAGSLLMEYAGSIVISSQVLSEFYWTVTRNLPSPLTAEEARTQVDWMRGFTVVPIDRDLVWEAIGLTDSASIAYWDALIVKAASMAGCRRLLTEDLSHGQIIDGVQIENPFVGL